MTGRSGEGIPSATSAVPSFAIACNTLWWHALPKRNEKKIKIIQKQKNKNKNKNSEILPEIFRFHCVPFPLFVSLSRSNPLSPLIDGAINHEYLQARRRYDSSPQHSRSPPQNLRHQIMFRSQITVHISQFPISFAFQFATITHWCWFFFHFQGFLARLKSYTQSCFWHVIWICSRTLFPCTIPLWRWCSLLAP